MTVKHQPLVAWLHSIVFIDPGFGRNHFEPFVTAQHSTALMFHRHDEEAFEVR